MVLEDNLLFTEFSLLQDRLKKLKSEHGKVQLGNITVDMVYWHALKFIASFFHMIFVLAVHSCVIQWHF